MPPIHHITPRRAAIPSIVITALVAVIAAAAALAACGSSPGDAASGGPSAVSSPASPAPKPLAGTPRQAVEAFWRLVDADAYDTLAAASRPGSSGLLTAAGDDIAEAELLRIVRVDRQPGSVVVQADVRIIPEGDVTPWGEPGRHTLFVELIEQTPGEWLVAGWGTSP